VRRAEVSEGLAAPWGSPYPDPAHPIVVVGAALVAALAVCAALAGALALGPWGAVGAAVATLATIAWWVGSQGRRCLAACRAKPAGAHAARLVNVATGLARDLGVALPELLILPEAGANALACRSRGRACVGVTSAFLATLTRTELEAVVAHCLVRLQGLEPTAAALVSAAGGRLPGVGPLVGRATDVRAAAVTRYPPALAGALTKASPRRRCSPLWLVGEGPSHEPLAARVDALRDL
jgi:hypothetical protein